MSGPAPKQQRRRRNVPERGEWQPSPGIGWQHGQIPRPSVAIHPDALAAWDEWMHSWFASHWKPEDLPGLSIVIGLYDQVLDYLREPMIEKEYVTTKGDTRTVWVPKPNPTSELRQLMDNYGITPKGQQDRRWSAPKVEQHTPAEPEQPGRLYGHLRAVGE